MARCVRLVMGAAHSSRPRRLAVAPLPDPSHRTVLPYGWRDFDQIVRIGRRDPAVVDTSPDGGIRCPLLSHDGEWLPWRDANARNGTECHGDPPLRLHASPTFVLCERLDNIIAGPKLAQEAIDGKWQKAETH